MASRCCTVVRMGCMTHSERLEIAQYLENAVDMYTATHFDPKTRRVQPKEMRDEIAQLLKWIKLLREET